MKEYLKNIVVSIWTILLGMRVTLSYFFKKPVTVQYPRERLKIAENYRGELTVNINTCTACLLCARNCPINAIKIEVEGKGKERLIKKFDIDMNICMLCGLCERPCQSGSIKLTQKYETAVYDKGNQILHFVGDTPVKAAIEVKKKDADKTN